MLPSLVKGDEGHLRPLISRQRVQRGLDGTTRRAQHAGRGGSIGDVDHKDVRGRHGGTHLEVAGQAAAGTCIRSCALACLLGGRPAKHTHRQQRRQQQAAARELPRAPTAAPCPSAACCTAHLGSAARGPPPCALHAGPMYHAAGARTMCSACWPHQLSTMQPGAPPCTLPARCTPHCRRTAPASRGGPAGAPRRPARKSTRRAPRSPARTRCTRSACRARGAGTAAAAWVRHGGQAANARQAARASVRLGGQ